MSHFRDEATLLAWLEDMLGPMSSWPAAQRAAARASALTYRSRFELVIFLLHNGIDPAHMTRWFELRGCLGDGEAQRHLRNLMRDYFGADARSVAWRQAHYTWCTTRHEYVWLSGGPVLHLQRLPPCLVCRAGVNHDTDRGAQLWPVRTAQGRLHLRSVCTQCLEALAED
jgi:hypothetical protein